MAGWPRFGASAAAWDLTALLNAANPRAPRAERHVWLVRLFEWLRHKAPDKNGGERDGATPPPVLRLRHLLNVLERHPQQAQPVRRLLARTWTEADLAAVFADSGFTARRDLWGELGERLRAQVLPLTPDTDDGATLLQLLFTDDRDPQWLRDIDAATLARLPLLLGGGDDGEPWQRPLSQALTWLVTAIRAAGFAPQLRQRMSPDLLVSQPFDQLADATEKVRAAIAAGDNAGALQHGVYLRALLAACERAAASVMEHLEEHGVSVHIVFEVDQLGARCRRAEAVLNALLAEQPVREVTRMLADVVQAVRERRSLRAPFTQHFSLLARKVAERHAETGEHYITRNRAEYWQMLRQAAGGGAIIAGTTFAKFAIAAIGLAPFWAGVGAGLNYAVSFVIVHLLHWTVATKQPAMTAPAMAEKLADLRDDAAVERFVDEVTHLVRSQMAGIIGNLVAVIPLVLAVQGLAWALLGGSLISEKEAHYVLHSLTLAGPTPLYAAFTGVLLFASSVVAGWAENFFVYHRLHSALAHHPAIVARLGAPRAARWAAWWRANISGMAANISLGLLLGVVPVMLAFIGVPLEVRHVTLATGQLMAAVSTLGAATLQQPDFWWCVAGIGVIGFLNLTVSFWLALRVALRSRGIAVADRQRLSAALWRRWRTAPLTFLRPPRDNP